MKKTIILLSGKINSGKNAFADLITEELKSKGYFVENDLFARDLKEYAMVDFRPLGKLLKNKVEMIKVQLGVFFELKFNDGGPELQTIHQMLDSFTFTNDNFFEDKTDITRVLLQQYGTEIARKRFDDKFWVKKAAERFNESIANFIIVTDVRFPNEIDDMYDMVDARIVPIRINRENKQSALIKSHASETALDDYPTWEYIIDNSGTLEELRESTKTVINSL